MYGVSSSHDSVLGFRSRLSYESATKIGENYVRIYKYHQYDAACATESACRGPVVSRRASTYTSNDEQAQDVQQSKHERYTIETKGMDPSWLGGSGCPDL